MKAILIASLLALIQVQMSARRAVADEPERPRSVSIQSADGAYRVAKEKAAQVYADSVKDALDEYVKSLDATLKDVMQKGDLDEANRINGWKRAILDQYNKQPDPPATAVKPSNGVVYLSDLEPFDVAVADCWFGKKGVARGDVKIIVNGRYSPNGICTHPPTNGTANVRFELGKGFSQFRTQVALNDETPDGRSWTAITFSVIGDGKELWKSLPIQVIRRVQDCSISVKGIKTLVLQVKCPGDYHYAHAVWLEPQLTPLITH